MRLRPPCTPLITVDPYFSIWSSVDVLTETDTVHWTDVTRAFRAYAEIDGTLYRFMGADESVPAMEQTDRDFDAFSTTYKFKAAGVELIATFTSPILPNDLELLTRPVSYLEVSVKGIDGKVHNVKVTVKVCEDICLNEKGQYPVVCETLSVDGCMTAKMGSSVQNVLGRAGDNVRIDWGYFYLTGDTASTVSFEKVGEDNYACLQSDVLKANKPFLVTFAYDDVYSINYYGTFLRSYWNRDGKTIDQAIAEARADYKKTAKRCREFSDKLYADATKAGGEKYAELLLLATRQTLAAHKLAVDTNGDLIYISKECFSNGCAATVDVTYPSIPIFLLYNPELIKGMLRPIYRYADSGDWKYEFAPHDAGRFPIITGQIYNTEKPTYTGTEREQMPVEECGNMLIIEAAIAVATKDTSFAKEHMHYLERWVQYLIENGEDPGEQLCTDDFAGRLSHNCNLTLKAIMGVTCMGMLYKMMGKKREGEKYIRTARKFALSWAERAANGDGSYRLTFDTPGSYSMKYNIVWDKLFGTNVMPKSVLASEFASYKKRMHPYGMPLDSRKPYTKSDWIVWTGTLAEEKEDFEDFVAPLWLAYHLTPSRVPMADWYWTVTSMHALYWSVINQKEISFRNRTVQGGLFMKLLDHSGIMRFDK